MKSSGKRKLSLIGTIISSLVMVGTASVATFAWFQASAAASVQTSSTSVDISVSAPPDVEVSNPAVFMYRGNPTGKTVDTHYTAVSTVEARKISNFYPGEVVTFAIKVTATSGSISNGSMSLTYQGFSLSNRTIYDSDPLKVVNILSAIKVSTGANSTGTYPSMTEKLSPLERGDEFELSDLTQVGDTAKYYKEDTIGDAISNLSIGGVNGYFFYTIEFLNTPDTLYIEKNSTGGAKIPVTGSDGETRYFTGGDTGSSTCYENLVFEITTAAITVS